MIPTDAIELIVQVTTFFIGYCASSTLAGAFRAWVAKKMGDDTAESSGFLSLNPLVHIDLLGTFSLLFFGIGWGKPVPINPFNIIGSWRNTRIFMMIFANVGAYIIIATITMILLLLLFDTNILLLPCGIAVGCSNHLSILNMYPDASSFLIIIGLILVDFVYLNSILGTIHIILNGVDMGFLLYNQSNEEYSESHYYENQYYIIIISLLLCYRFLPQLYLLLLAFIQTISLKIVSLMGAL